MRAAYRSPAFTVFTRPLMRGVVGVIFHILGRVRVTGRENVPMRQPYIAAINHVSIIDPPAVLVFWPEILEAIGAVDVFDKPIQGQMLRMYGTIPVHRGDYDRLLIDKVLSLLRAGRPVMIAPEGGRSHVPGLRRAKPGVGFILQKADVPVIPVALVGTTGDFIQRGLRGERPQIEIHIGRPIRLPPVPEDPVKRRSARQEVADLVMSYIAGLLPEGYRGVYSGSAIPPPKPVTEVWRPELVRLPPRTPARRILRSILQALMRAIVRLALKAEMRGLENFPRAGPALVVINHLGDADVPLVVGGLPRELDGFAKIELHSFPMLGAIFEWYGVIWLHRGQPDRRALRAALQGLAEGRIIAIAPEGRYSLVQGMESASDGAAFLARHADIPILPVSLTGTENDRVYASLRRLRRAPVTLTVGVPFKLGDESGTRQRRSDRLAADTERIMQSLADLLPEEYRGVYGQQKKEES